MKRALAATLSAASLLFAVGCSESPTAPDAASVRAPSRALASNPQGWTINKTVVDMQKECTPKGIENGMTCMRPVGSLTASNALAVGDTVWIQYQVRITSPTPGATATVIDDVIKQCQQQLGPSFGCSAWGIDVPTLAAGMPIQMNADATVYTLHFWLDIWNINACVPKNFTNTATLVPGSPPGATIHSGATVTINVIPAPGCNPPPPPGNEGCSPGFWKNKGAKSGLYVTTRKVNTVFNFAGTPYVAQGNQTLLQAVGNGGGGVDALLRQAVAAYLNAESTAVDYPLTTAQVVAMVNGALNGTLNMENVKDQLDRYNNLHGAKICG